MPGRIEKSVVFHTKKSHSRTFRSQDPDVKQKLLKAAKHLFATKGLSGTTIRDIAQRAKVNSSMISYYFSGKEGLYRECVEEIGEMRFRIARQILQAPQTLDEFRVRISMFLENMFELFLEDRETGLIIIREYDRVRSPADEIFRRHFVGVYEVIVDFFRSAHKKGFVKNDRNPPVLASLFFGTFFSQLRLEHWQEKTEMPSLKRASEKKEIIRHIAAIFCGTN